MITQSLRRPGLPGPLRQLTYVLIEKVVRNLGPVIEPKILQDIVDAVLVDCRAGNLPQGGAAGPGGSAAQRQYAVGRLRDTDRSLVCAGALQVVMTRELSPFSRRGERRGVANMRGSLPHRCAQVAGTRGLQAAGNQHNLRDLI